MSLYTADDLSKALNTLQTYCEERQQFGLCQSSTCVFGWTDKGGKRRCYIADCGQPSDWDRVNIKQALFKEREKERTKILEDKMKKYGN